MLIELIIIHMQVQCKFGSQIREHAMPVSKLLIEQFLIELTNVWPILSEIPDKGICV